MVLPPSTAHDAPRPGEAAWLEPLKLALGLSRSGLLLLVDHARPELLGELVRALLPEHPELEVHTEVQRMLEVPHGSTLVLVPRAEDADWLNINRPVFAQRELRVVLFCDTETTVALARRAVDFFDWISHRVECPSGTPRFAIAGIRCALAARAPGIVWQGGDLEATFAAARPRGKLHKVSAARPYAEMLAEVTEHRRAWIAWTDIDSHFRLRRVRWALAETGHRTRTFLVEPAVSSPGWWPVHARPQDVREARALLEKAGASSPGCVAALNELEPEALTYLQSLLEHGLDAPTLEAGLMAVNSPEGEPDPSLQGLGRQFARSILRGEAPPPIMRAFKPEHLRQLCRTELAAITERLQEDEQVEFKDLSSWTAWTTKPGPDLSPWSLELAIEMLLRDHTSTPVRWTALALWAIRAGALDAADVWAQRAEAEGTPNAHLVLASVKYAQGRLDEAESLIHAHLPDKETSLAAEHPLYHSASLIQAGVLLKRGKPKEAEALLRQARSITSRTPEGHNPFHGAMVYKLAQTLSAQGKHSEAETLLRQALSSAEIEQGAVPSLHGGSLHELARALAAQRKYSEAETVLRQALSVMERTMGATHPLYVNSLHDLATHLLHQGRHAEAEALFQQALPLIARTLGTEHPAYEASLSGLSTSLQNLGRYEEAEARRRQALAIAERTVGTEHPTYASSLHELASLLQTQGRYAEAEALFRQALSIKERVLGSGHPNLCPTLANLGLVLAQQNRHAEGEPLFSRALELSREAYGSSHPGTATILTMLAKSQDDSGNRKAPETARKALEALAQAFGPEHPLQRAKPTLEAILAKAPQSLKADEQ
ncbi:tetratricopeptide repeat protein [Archangium gephyra]|uniref:tetratricopeptide repeat protein n=1 Tax=Archangium gephyra TaxID=48 RepID=UPI003B78A140